MPNFPASFIFICVLGLAYGKLLPIGNTTFMILRDSVQPASHCQLTSDPYRYLAIKYAPKFTLSVADDGRSMGGLWAEGVPLTGAVTLETRQSAVPFQFFEAGPYFRYFTCTGVYWTNKTAAFQQLDTACWWLNGDTGYIFGSCFVSYQAPL